MRLWKNSDRAVALITIMIWVTGFVIGPVGATAGFSPSADTGTGISTGNAPYHHAFNSTRQEARLQTVLANLSQQGVDVNQAQADLTAGNMTAAFQLLTAYHQNHPDLALDGPRQHVINATAQTEHIQTLIADLSQQGVDVSQVQADLTAGNTTGAMKDLMALRKDHPGMMANTTQQAARLQTGVTKLAQQGVDVTEVQADISSGNLGAAMQWMAAYHTAYLSGNGTGMHGSNSTQWQKGGSFRSHTPGSFNQTTARSRFAGGVQAT